MKKRVKEVRPSLFVGIDEFIVDKKQGKEVSEKLL